MAVDSGYPTPAPGDSGLQAGLYDEWHFTALSLPGLKETPALSADKVTEPNIVGMRPVNRGVERDCSKILMDMQLLEEKMK